MINGIGKSGTGRIETQRSGGAQSGAPASAADAPGASRGNGVGSVVSELASSGAPIDGGKVAAIRQAIAEGRYQIDPEAIAERMVETDLPT